MRRTAVVISSPIALVVVALGACTHAVRMGPAVPLTIGDPTSHVLQMLLQSVVLELGAIAQVIGLSSTNSIHLLTTHGNGTRPRASPPSAN